MRLLFCGIYAWAAYTLYPAGIFTTPLAHFTLLDFGKLILSILFSVIFVVAVWDELVALSK